MKKSFITSGPSHVWTFIEDVCAYIYDDKSYKKSINKYTAHLGKLNRSVFAFMR